MMMMMIRMTTILIDKYDGHVDDDDHNDDDDAHMHDDDVGPTRDRRTAEMGREAKTTTGHRPTTREGANTTPPRASPLCTPKNG
jgi:hypothetical protein